MPSYLDWLLRMRGLGRRTVSTTELADGMKLGWTVVRKDVALVGVAGRPRVGYDVDRLVDGLEQVWGIFNGSL
jgi:redox-sensing transcriptional repressor